MPKKILYLITQSELGGAQRYVLDLATGLKKDFDVSVAYGEPGTAGWLAQELSKENIPNYYLPHLKRAISPLNDFLAFFEIVKLIKQLQPDIIHLNSSKISILGSLAKLRVTSYKLRVVYTVHGWVFNEPLPGWQKAFYFWAEKITAETKDKLICVSDYDRQVALAKKIAPTDKLVNIHNGIKVISFLSREEARAKINSNNQETISKQYPISDIRYPNCSIGSIGNLYPTKGYVHLIRAAAMVVKERPEVTFSIIGKGSEKTKLENLIGQLHLENNFFIFDRIDYPAAALLKAFEIYVNSSVKEGLSYTLIEAMQAGLPIIATAVGGNPELIKNNATGLLVNPAEPDILAQAILQLIADQDQGQRLGAAASECAQTKFNLETMVAQTKSIYN